jgi:hypothetical protein
MFICFLFKCGEYLVTCNKMKNNIYIYIYIYIKKKKEKKKADMVAV